MKQILYKLFEHQYLGRDEARTILQNIAQGKYNDVQVASLITVFLMRNISVEELCGFRDALLEMRIPVDLSDFAPIDIVGTGGDGKNTFNISTASCFTVAGAGFPVVKHGNYGATSVSGASNVMEQHGVKFTSDVDQLRRSMEKCNLAYLHAPLFNPALKAVAPVRRGLAVRTFFNMLGPLVNPVLPIWPIICVKNVRGNSQSGWNPTKLPIRGYISSTGIVAWPQPNVWTQRPASMESAITVAAFLMFSNWVASSFSIMPWAFFNHSSANITFLFFKKLINLFE